MLASELTAEEQARHCKRLKARAERFAKLVGLDAPSILLARDFVMLLRSMTLLYGQEIGEAQADYLRERDRAMDGRCICCGTTTSDKHPVYPMCPKCAKEGEDLANDVPHSTGA